MNEKPVKKDESGDYERATHPLSRVSLRAFESLIDQHVRKAEEEGQFKDLEGAGKPLKLEEDDAVPAELRTGHRMLKNAGYAPPWIEQQKGIREDQESLARWLADCNRRWARLGRTDRERLRAEYEQRLRDLNKAIGEYNLTAPPAAGQIPLLQIERELLKLGAG